MLIDRSVGRERNSESDSTYTKPPFIPFSEFKNDTVAYLKTNLSKWYYGNGLGAEKREDLKVFLDDFYRQTPQIKSMYIENTMEYYTTSPGGSVVRIFVFVYTPEQIAYKFKNNMPIYGVYLQLYPFYANAGSKKYNELKSLGLDRVIPVTSEAIKLIEDLKLSDAFFMEDLRKCAPLAPIKF